MIRALILSAAIATATLAQPPTTPPPAAPSQPPAEDGLDPARARDFQHYNLDKSGLAIQGYDPVAYFPEGGGKPTPGLKSLDFKYRGVTYRFATQANLDRFKSDPRKYEPAHGGWCSTAMAEGKKVEIDPKAFKVTNGRLFLFYTNLISDARSTWNKDEPGNTKKADTHWKQISGEEPRLRPDPAAPRKGG